ncbi:hypothetical protein CH373_18240 [Leptospira perolatii]|uniref:Glycosyltransferase RgtA/B/C/D-like domain-containing protein n=1 Tax=Leptospira perolatii TaxID=2023191 RepID=A0A2M9ZHY9_9LEPT|nr:hypothetical protein [Leptospira perolatii]PJZ68041.1 hypothetical protein CH360_18260 [Leptospira perolatii]PJZ71677.1 hypothetical protein CH373_18240 [Leptospira perolatii]
MIEIVKGLFRIPAARLFAVASVSFLLFYKLSPILYDAVYSSRVYSTGFYFLVLDPFGVSMNWDTILTPLFLHFVDPKMSPEKFAKILLTITSLSGSLISVLGFYYLRGLGFILLGFVYLASPLMLVQLNWIGFPDNITVLFSFLLISILLRKEKDTFYYLTLGLVLSVGMLNHYFQFFLIGLILLSAKSVYLNQVERKDFFVFGFSACAALIFAFCFIKWNGIPFRNTRVDAATSFALSDLLRNNLSYLHYGIISLFHGLFPLALWMLYKEKRS